ncbi:MAG: ABC transporter substrate-binding protein [Romboutsia sp.]
MNKKIALIAGIAIVGLIGGMLVFSNKEKNKVSTDTQEIVKVEHAVGTTDVVKNPEKIVVFDYAALDAIEALGIEGVIGVPKGSVLPTYLTKFEADEYGNVGALKEPDLEKVNELKPDLIIINGRQHSFYDKLTEIAPTISLSKEDGQYMRDFTKNMKIIGDIFNKEDKVEEELSKINEKIAEVNKVVVKNRYEATTLMTSEGSLSVFGADSRFGTIYNDFGFKNSDKNIKAADHGQEISFEYVASQDSDFIFVIDKSVIDTKTKQQSAQELLNNDLMNNSKAVKNGNIIYLDTPSWYTSDGGIISTNTMIDEISKAINK